MRYFAYALAACWALFLLVWLVGAFFTKATRFKPGTGRVFILRVLLVCFIYIFVAHRIPGHVLQLQILPRTALSCSLALAVTACGVAFAIWARLTLGRNWSSMPQLKQGHELIVKGPYALVRHPIYTGISTALLGTALFVGQLMWAPILLLCGIFFFFKIKLEEELMLRNFPTQYPGYRRKVKAIIPWIL